MSTRRTLVLGNWKMNLSLAQARGLASDLARRFAGSKGGAELGVCPSPVHLLAVGQALEGSSVQLGAQDTVAQTPGAFTGGVAAEQLRECGVRFTLVGHSERRAIFGDDDAAVAAKLRAAHRAGLGVVLCVGENLDERDAGKTEAVVLGQFDAALEGLAPERLADVVVAYEPVWAIGTGRNADADDAQHVHAQLRARCAERFGGDRAASLRILYGGSVKPANAADYFGRADIDGALVGGASLEAESFAAIADAAL